MIPRLTPKISSDTKEMIPLLTPKITSDTKEMIPLLTPKITSDTKEMIPLLTPKKWFHFWHQHKWSHFWHQRIDPTSDTKELIPFLTPKKWSHFWQKRDSTPDTKEISFCKDSDWTLDATVISLLPQQWSHVCEHSVWTSETTMRSPFWNLSDCWPQTHSPKAVAAQII